MFHYIMILYNQDDLSATQFTFPYKAKSFDVIFLFSVFTHMLPDEIEHYLKEISRMLKPGGICLTTLFLYEDSESDYFVYTNKFQFSHERFRFPSNG